MASSRRTRRRLQQKSLERHQLRLEGLEKRYALNAAPVLDPSASPQLNSVIEDAGIPVGEVGTLVSDLIDTGGTHDNFSDADGDPPGIAITGTNLGDGTLWYSINRGTDWSQIADASDSQPLRLAANDTTRLFFQPPTNFSGVASDVFTFKAWDQDVSEPSIYQPFGNEIDQGFNGQITRDGNVFLVGSRTYGWDESSASFIEVGGSINDAYDPVLSDDGLRMVVGFVDDGHIKLYHRTTVHDDWQSVGRDIPLYSNGIFQSNKFSLSGDGNVLLVKNEDYGFFDPTVYRWSESLNDWGTGQPFGFYGTQYNGGLPGRSGYTNYPRVQISHDGNIVSWYSGGTLWVFGYSENLSAYRSARFNVPSTPAGANTGSVIYDCVMSSEGDTFAIHFIRPGGYDPQFTRVFGFNKEIFQEESLYYLNAWQIGGDIVHNAPFLSLSDNGEILASTGVSPDVVGEYNTTIFSWDPGSSDWLPVGDVTTLGNTGVSQEPDHYRRSAISGDGNTFIINGDKSYVYRLGPTHSELSTAMDTVSVRITAVNDAPGLDVDASPRLHAVDEEAAAPVGLVGTLVSDLIDKNGPLSNFSDVDGDSPGIAITSTSLQGGTLWYTVNNGLSWIVIEDASETDPLLLMADNATRLYYQPAQGFSGTISNVFTFRAWDQNANQGPLFQQIGADIDGEQRNSFLGNDLVMSGDGMRAIIGSLGSMSRSIQTFQRETVGFEWSQVGSEIEFEFCDLSNDGQSLVVSTAPVYSYDGVLVSNAVVRAFQWDQHALDWQEKGSDVFVSDGNGSSAGLVKLSEDGNTVVALINNTTNNTTNTTTSVFQWNEQSSIWEPKGTILDVSGNFAISDDGKTIAVRDAGRIRIFRWNDVDSNWLEFGQVTSTRSDNTQADDSFGMTMALSKNGNILVVGAPAGAVNVAGYSQVFQFNAVNQIWEQLGSDIDAMLLSGTTIHINIGSSVAISSSGDFIAIRESRGWLHGEGTSPTHVFQWNGTDWYKLTSIEMEPTNGAGPISISDDGRMLAIGWSTYKPNTLASNRNKGRVRFYKMKAFNSSLSNATDFVSVEINSENDLPTLDALSDITLPQNASGQLVRLGNVTAGAGEVQSLRVTATSSNPSLIQNPFITTLPELSADSRLLSFAPQANQDGVATITVTVEDAGLDGDLDNINDNGVFSQTFDVTVTPDSGSPPVLQSPYGVIFVNEAVTGNPDMSYQIPALNVDGEAINGLFNRITVTSSDTALVPDPTVLYASADVPSSLSFTPVANAHGTATLSIQVEDGGPDNDFTTTEDNRQATHQVEVTVLQIISNSGSAILAKDSSESLYVNTQPVIYNQQQVPQAFFGSSVVGTDSSDSENALMLKPSGADAEDPPTHRLLTDDTWRINGIFNSLQNASSPVLDLSGREVSVPLNIVAVAGAYEINGVNNPTLIVRRGQTYTFNLDASGHPFWLQTTGNGHQEANSYSDGFTGNSQTTGEHQWIVPVDAPDEIFYQCEFHPVMFGKIIVVD